MMAAGRGAIVGLAMASAVAGVSAPAAAEDSTRALDPRFDPGLDPRLEPPRPCAACVRYHVAEDGDDEGDGSAEHPFRTIQAAADRVAPGDIVLVHRGRYAGFEIHRSGEPMRPIWFVGEAAVVRGNNPSTPDGINLEGADWVGIVGFRVTGAGRAGIRAVDCDSVVIAGNEAVDNQRWGIFTGFCDNLIIEDNEAAGSRDEHGIYVSNSPENAVVRRNLIHDNRQAGLHMNGDLSAGGHGLIKNALVDSNVIFRVGKGGAAGINCDGIQGSTIRNNLIFDAHAHGITLYRIDGAEGSKQNTVAHNTIVVAEDGRYALHIHHGSTHNRVFSNILFNRHPVNGSLDVMEDSLEGLASDGNVVIDRVTLDDWETVVGLEAWRARSGQDAASVVVSSLDEAIGEGFVPRGPAVDAASPLAVPSLDLRATRRPVGSGADIGAIEACDACPRGEPIRGTTALAEAAPIDDLSLAGGGCRGCSLAVPTRPPLWWALALMLALRRKR